MTREQIRQDSEGIVRTACNLQRNVGLSDANAAVEAKLITLVRATMEEDARAVCPWCCEETDAKGNHDGAVRADPQGVRWVHRIRSRPCLAMRIHDLIAAMDKEAKGEG